MTVRIDPGSDRAVYRQIADHLRAEIERGVREPGSQLPSESQLMAEYDVSRVTARRALALLVTDGLVVSEHGRG
jgi:GntR family transcriptional regulator